ncbi:MAG TPA: hypothetical protein VMM57_06195 [Bacteroidota bacterium]|nr:hypothetical protein [Bacteroidota bacterium]
MVSGFIILIHVAACCTAFVLYRKEGLSHAWLAVAFFVVIFSAGWTLSTLMTNLLFEIRWIAASYDSLGRSWMERVIRKQFNRDAIALLILTACELGFYYFVLLGDEGGPKGRNK